MKEVGKTSQREIESDLLLRQQDNSTIADG